MPRYRPVWLEIAEQQYRNLPDDVRDLVDRRLAPLFRKSDRRSGCCLQRSVGSVEHHAPRSRLPVLRRGPGPGHGDCPAAGRGTRVAAATTGLSEQDRNVPQGDPLRTRSQLPVIGSASVRWSFGLWNVRSCRCASGLVADRGVLVPVIGGAPTVAVGERDAVIEPEEIGALVLRRLVLDEDDQVAHPRGDHLGGSRPGPARRSRRSVRHPSRPAQLHCGGRRGTPSPARSNLLARVHLLARPWDRDSALPYSQPDTWSDPHA